MPSSLARLRRTQPPRVIIYARVSKDQQEGRSVSQQLKLGRQVAEESGWEVVEEYSDNDRSASQYARGTREDWPKVENLIRSGRADILWLWELSRGTRDRIVWAHLVDACQTHRMHIALDDDLWDTTNPDHMKYLDSMMIDSIHESGKTRKRVVRDMQSHAEEGKPHGYTHYAYDREYDSKTGKLVSQTPNPVRGGRCKQIADWLLIEKWARSRIAAHLNREKIRTPRGYLMGEARVTKKGRKIVSQGWTHQLIDRLMSSPSLMGKRSYNGRIIADGGWEPVLDEPTWWAVQKVLGKGGFGAEEHPYLGGQEDANPGLREGAADYLVSAIMVCDRCDAPVYAKPPASSKPTSYYCSGLGIGAQMHGTRSVEVANHAIEVQLFERLDHPDVRAALVPVEDTAKARRSEMQVATWTAELEELYADVEADRVSRRMAQADERRLLDALEAARKDAIPKKVDPLMVELASGDPRAVWSGWSLSQRRAALRLLTEPKGIRMLAVGPGRAKHLPEAHVRIVWHGQGAKKPKGEEGV